eukprot:GILJ01024650.1.p1 GENE.GILJ01024650.1~~GILJ01024650.1.p1  ORF type:complete len:377 (-),score=39.55 GILJ01024650.1:114-1244(-)
MEQSPTRSIDRKKAECLKFSSRAPAERGHPKSIETHSTHIAEVSMTHQQAGDSLNVSGITVRSGRTTPRRVTPTTIRIEAQSISGATTPRAGAGSSIASPLSAQHRVKVFSEPLPSYARAAARHAVPPLTEAQHRAAQSRSVSVERATCLDDSEADILARYNPLAILAHGSPHHNRTVSPNAGSPLAPKENNAARARRSCSAERGRSEADTKWQTQRLMCGNVGAALEAIHKGSPNIGLVGSPTSPNYRQTRSVALNAATTPTASPKKSDSFSAVAGSPRKAASRCTTPRGTVITVDYATSVSYEQEAAKDASQPLRHNNRKSTQSSNSAATPTAIKLQCRGYYSPVRNTFTPNGKKHSTQLQDEAASAKARQKPK